MNSNLTILRGITWDHTRGLLPVVATGQLFSEQNPEIAVVWEKRSLQAFADQPIDVLAETYDLLVIDHPWAGHALNRGIVVPLDEHLPKEFLADQQAQQVGKSHDSYVMEGQLSALAIDAATPVACWRPDLLSSAPQTWDEVMALARRGKVVMPGIPVDVLMHFYMFCGALGEFPFLNEERVVSRETGHAALVMYRDLAKLCDPAIFGLNPIRTYIRMSSSNAEWYCPFAYSYSNYARRGYAPHRLAFGDLVSVKGNRLCSTLGGTGLAVSSKSRHRAEALRYAQFVAEPEIQRTVYTAAGGQPGHRSAWLDEENNAASGGYFAATLPTLDRAFLRPRYDGYLHFQDLGGTPIREYLMRGGDERAVLSELDRLYAESLKLAHR